MSTDPGSTEPTSVAPSTDPAPAAALPDPFVAHDGIMTVSKLNLSLLLLAIGSIAAALYLSPISTPLRNQVQQDLSSTVDSRGAGLSAPNAASTPSSTTRTTSTATATKASTSKASPTLGRTATASSIFARLPGTGSGAVSALLTSGGTGSSATSTPTGSGAGSSSSPSPSTTAPPAKTKCYQFTWQQDAQAVYVTNLSDPYGLDGAPGPYDSDGIACSGLPVDPSRSPSTPIGQYVPPTASADTKAAIVSSRTAYYGFTEDGLPGDTSKFDALESAAGKAPSTVGWYQSFDDTYRGDLVSRSWSRGALPVFTWMPMATSSDSSYSLTTIANGDYDAYLRKFAGDIVRTNLPVVIRFGHEMNGGWYGWSAGRSEWNNSPDKFKAAWIHVWQIFESVGANDDAIWLWSPSRVDNLKPSATSGVSVIADDYPGDAYVDWVGASIYLRHATTGPTYDATFGKTITALEAVTTKPLFFAEVGSIETDGATDESTLKSTFIHNTLAAFAADPRIVGFLWNNNISAQVVDGQRISNDWRFNSNPTAAQQFVTDIASSRFRTGLVTAD